MEQEIMLQTGRICLEEDGIVRATYFPKAEETLAEAKEHIAAVVKVSRGNKYPVLVDCRKLKSITREAREYYAGKETANAVNAMAVLMGSPVSRTLGNFFMRLNKPLSPTRLFTSETEALEWLKGFIQ